MWCRTPSGCSAAAAGRNCSAAPRPAIRAIYRPNPASKNYVQHLRLWYAQSHPDEDFAETFAVWLKPRSDWRKRYAGWPALRKLEYVDELMDEIAGQRSQLPRGRPVHPLSQIDTTLGEHYRKKQALYAVHTPRTYDRELHRIFSADPKHRRVADGGLLHPPQPLPYPADRGALDRRISAHARFRAR